MSLDSAEAMWEHMKKLGKDDLPPTEAEDEATQPAEAVVGAVRCIRCGAITSGEKCRGCGFCVGCEGGCAA